MTTPTPPAVRTHRRDTAALHALYRERMALVGRLRELGKALRAAGMGKEAAMLPAIQQSARKRAEQAGRMALAWTREGARL